MHDASKMQKFTCLISRECIENLRATVYACTEADADNFFESGDYDEIESLDYKRIGTPDTAHTSTTKEEGDSPDDCPDPETCSNPTHVQAWQDAHDDDEDDDPRISSVYASEMSAYDEKATREFIPPCLPGPPVPADETGQGLIFTLGDPCHNGPNG